MFHHTTMLHRKLHCANDGLQQQTMRKVYPLYFFQMLYQNIPHLQKNHNPISSYHASRKYLL